MTEPEINTRATDANHPPDPSDERTQPHAVREIAGMFDDVSGRYELLNRIMSLGRDESWRRAMWDEVPDEARVVLDLCTGNGSSLAGLRMPGRTVLGIDASLGMLALAAETQGSAGWAPRLVCADAFRLPLANRSIDCVTVAFGARNLRPRRDALAEIFRVLGPGGRLVVLEATAPRPGLLSNLHQLYIRRVIPFAGRLSPDPSAYEYLSRSILEFGAGPEFENDLATSGFRLVRRRSFLFGATGLWVAARPREVAGGPAAEADAMQAATLGKVARGEMPSRSGERGFEWKIWNGAQLVISTALTVVLAYALWLFLNSRIGQPLEPWQRGAMRVLLIGGTVAFVIRSVVLWARFLGSPPKS